MTAPQERFQSMATVFILQDKTWIERGSGLVRFVFDLKTYALKLVIRPGTSEEYECKLRPRIRSKGPRAYVVRAQSDTGDEEHILAVRFEREEDSRAFRKFVEKRDGTDNKKNKPQSETKPQPPGVMNTAVNNDSHYEYMDPLTAAHQQQAYARQQYNIHMSSATNQIQNQNQSNLPSIAEYIQHQHQLQSQQHLQQDLTSTQPTNYFWNCHRCLQMNDISHTACSVCGSARATRIQQRSNMNVVGTTNHQYIPQQQPQSSNIPQQQQYAYQTQAQQQSYGNILQNMSNIQNMNNMQAYQHTQHHQQFAHGQSHILRPHTPQHLNNYQHPSYAMVNPQQQQQQQRSITGVEGHVSSHQNIMGMHGGSGRGGMYGGSGSGGGSGGGSGAGAGGNMYGNMNSKPPLVVKLTNANLEKHNVLHPPLRRNVGEIIHQQLHFLAQQQSQTVQ